MCTCVPLTWVLLDFQGYIEQELQICEGLASTCGHIKLDFERVVFTDTGTLLLTWVDPSGRIEPMREKFRAQFPGMTADALSVSSSVE